MHHVIKPKILNLLSEGYSFKKFLKDLFAGIIVGIITLPMSIAFAIASGARPEQGIYTAIIAGFLTSLFSGSRVQIGGPTGAFVVLIYGVIQNYGYEGLFVATLMAGVILIILGFIGLGGVMKFIPYPVIIGFTSGIAVILFVSQVRDFLGLDMEFIPVDFIDKIVSYSSHILTFDPATVIVGMLAMVIIIFWKRISLKIPGPLVAIIITTLLVKFCGLQIATIGSHFGDIPTTMPTLAIPKIDWMNINQLVPSAIAIALLAGIESLLSATVADGMIGTRHRSNMELIAQGLSNIGSALFGGLPATGAIARTATNIKNGGRSPIAGLVSALVVLALVMFFGSWFSLIPLSTLAAIIIVVAYNMSEWRHFVRLFLSPREDILVLLITFFLTVFVNLTTALEVGTILSAFLFINRLVDTSSADYLKKSIEEDSYVDDMPIDKFNVDSNIEVFEINGSFFFAAVESFKTALGSINRVPKVLVIRMRNVLIIDASGIRAIMDLQDKLKKQGTLLMISGMHSQSLELFAKTGLVKMIGEENIFHNISEALQKADEILL